MINQYAVRTNSYTQYPMRCIEESPTSTFCYPVKEVSDYEKQAHDLFEGVDNGFIIGLQIIIPFIAIIVAAGGVLWFARKLIHISRMK